jgi:hypothetical protein
VLPALRRFLSCRRHLFFPALTSAYIRQPFLEVGQQVLLVHGNVDWFAFFPPRCPPTASTPGARRTRAFRCARPASRILASVARPLAFAPGTWRSRSSLRDDQAQDWVSALALVSILAWVQVSILVLA